MTDLAAPDPKLFTDTRIVMENPVSKLFQEFVVCNAMTWQSRAIIEIEPLLEPEIYEELKAEMFAHRPGLAFGSSVKFHDYIDPFAKQQYFVEPGTGKGQHLIICGAGPSLVENIAEYEKKADQIWGCNSAVTWLSQNGHKPTHAFTVDQTSHMYLEWRDAPDDIEYLVATTIHPYLADLLVKTGRRFRYFNNFVGMKMPPVKWPDAQGVERVMSYEEWMYSALFPGTIQAGSGLNAVTRALDIAAYMEFDKVTVLGADCCIRTKGKPNPKWALRSPEHTKWLKKNTVMHANGGHALASEATGMVFQATIDGKFWMTKPDMVITCEWLIRMAKASKGRITLVGANTLPVALYDKDEKFWERMPGLTDSDGERMKVPF